MTVRYWTSKSGLYEFDYDTGTHSPVVGEIINVDVAAGEFATVQSWTVASGAWGTNDAAGKMWVYSASQDFIDNLANLDNIDDSADNQICIATGGVTAIETDWQVAGNWGEGEDPAVPLADDEVIFDDRSTISPLVGMLDSESGHVDQCTYDLLHIKVGFTGDIGSVPEPLCCAPDTLIIEGSGDYHILCGKTNQATDADIDDTIINNPNGTVYLYTNSNEAGTTAIFTDIWVVAGTITLAYYTPDTNDYGVACTNLYMSPRNGKAKNVTVTIEKDAYKVNGTVAMNIYMNNGTLTTDSRIGTFVQRLGTTIYGTDLTTAPETDLNIDAMRMHGGTFHWRPDDSDDDAYIGSLWLFGGTFDASSAINNDRDKALGNGAGNDVYVFDGSTMKLNNGRGNITIAAGSQLWNFGGTVLTDNNSQIGITYDAP